MVTWLQDCRCWVHGLAAHLIAGQLQGGCLSTTADTVLPACCPCLVVLPWPPPRRNPSISTTLVGMASSAVVQANVQAVLQALGCDPNGAADTAAAEKAALAEVERILAPVKNISWASGKPENN